MLAIRYDAIKNTYRFDLPDNIRHMLIWLLAPCHARARYDIDYVMPCLLANSLLPAHIYAISAAYACH